EAGGAGAPGRKLVRFGGSRSAGGSPCPPGRSGEGQCSARQQSGGRDVHV
ncbi:MAG: hypothetical protein AVDCRST_MAG14-314, partial [uncultured Rubrobacteraceae bacterium]